MKRRTWIALGIVGTGCSLVGVVGEDVTAGDTAGEASDTAMHEESAGGDATTGMNTPKACVYGEWAESMDWHLESAALERRQSMIEESGTIDRFILDCEVRGIDVGEGTTLEVALECRAEGSDALENDVLSMAWSLEPRLRVHDRLELVYSRVSGNEAGNVSNLLVSRQGRPILGLYRAELWFVNGLCGASEASGASGVQAANAWLEPFGLGLYPGGCVDDGVLRLSTSVSDPVSVYPGTTGALNSYSTLVGEARCEVGQDDSGDNWLASLAIWEAATDIGDTEYCAAFETAEACSEAATASHDCLWLESTPVTLADDACQVAEPEFRCHASPRGDLPAGCGIAPDGCAGSIIFQRDGDTVNVRELCGSPTIVGFERCTYLAPFTYAPPECGCICNG